MFRNWPGFGDPVQTVGGDSGGVGDAGFVVLAGDGVKAFDVVAAHAATTGEHRDGPFRRPGRQCTSQRLNPSRPLHVPGRRAGGRLSKPPNPGRRPRDERTCCTDRRLRTRGAEGRRCDGVLLSGTGRGTLWPVGPRATIGDPAGCAFHRGLRFGRSQSHLGALAEFRLLLASVVRPGECALSHEQRRTAQNDAPWSHDS